MRSELVFIDNWRRRLTVSYLRVEGRIRPKSLIIIEKFENLGEEAEKHVNQGCKIACEGEL